VLEALKKEGLIELVQEKLYAGFEKARQTGRFEILQKDPYVIIDGAHNEAGAESLRAVLEEHFSGRRILMIVGMLADKKIDKLLEKFEKITDDFIATEPDNPRKLSASALCKQITDRGNRCIAMESPEAVCRFADSISSS
jgi:dihydrofolate synthase/folylpolyglutamate synthase